MNQRTASKIARGLAIVLAALVVQIVLIWLGLSATGGYSLIGLGDLAFKLGLAEMAVGFLFVNFRRTPTDVHIRHQGDRQQQRRIAREDLGDFNIGFLIIFAGLVLSGIGWLMINYHFCKALVC